MKKLTEKKPSSYHENAMMDAVCLVCGERMGKYGFVYHGKAVCSGCVDYIRMHF